MFNQKDILISNTERTFLNALCYLYLMLSVLKLRLFVFIKDDFVDKTNFIYKSWNITIKTFLIIEWRQPCEMIL